MTPNRARAAQACIDRFAGRSFGHAERRDCARMASHLLHGLGIKVACLKGHQWSTASGAARVLRKLGFANIHDGIDSLGLPRIGWASARIGDLIALPTACPMGAVGVHVGNGAVLCYRDGHDTAVVVRLENALFAWRTC